MQSQQSSPVQPGSLSLTVGLPPLPAFPDTWCYLPYGRVARTRRNNCRQPSPAALASGTKHRVPAQSQNVCWVSKEFDHDQHSPQNLTSHQILQPARVFKPSTTSRLSFILSGLLCGPHLLASHEKIKLSADARQLVPAHGPGEVWNQSNKKVQMQAVPLAVCEA